MYIIITEFQDIRYANSAGGEDLRACDDGILNIIDIAGDIPKQYGDGEWTELQAWNE